MAKLDGKGRWRMKLNFLKGSPPRINYWLEEGLGSRYDLGVQWGAMEGIDSIQPCPVSLLGWEIDLRRAGQGILRGPAVFADKLCWVAIGPSFSYFPEISLSESQVGQSPDYGSSATPKVLAQPGAHVTQWKAIGWHPNTLAAALKSWRLKWGIENEKGSS